MILVIKHIASEGPGTIEDFFSAKGYALKTIDLYRGQKLPQNLTGIEAVISMGGPMNVDEEEKYPFLKEEDIFLKKVIDAKIPFFGVCLGSQLLAKAVGAKVTKSPKEEIGWFKVGLTSDGKKDSIFEGIDGEFDVFQWHGDTFEIPKNGKHLATAVGCRHQALKVGTCAYGFQFHIEVTKEIIADWVKEHFKSVDGEVTKEGQKIIDDFAQYKTQFNTRANIIYENFERLIKGKG